MKKVAKKSSTKKLASTKKVVKKTYSVDSWKTRMQGYLKRGVSPDEIAKADWALLDECFYYRYQ